MTDSRLNPFASPRSPIPAAPPALSWVGWYEYAPFESDELGHSRVTFTMSWKYGWFGHFSGPVQDGPESDMQEIGQVKGFLRNSKIEFTKYMPVESIILPGGGTAKTDRRHPPIHYYGRFDSNNCKLLGRWYTVCGARDCCGNWEAVPLQRYAPLT